MNCSNCEMGRACKSSLDLVSQKKTYSTDINMLIRKPPNKYHQMLPHYEYKLEQNNIDFESVRKISMKKDYKMVVKRRFERIYNMTVCKSYMKNEDTPEKKEIFIYGFKYNKTDKIDNYILFGCESDELFESDKLFNFCSNKFIIKEKGMRKFKITGWSFMTLVKKTTVLKFRVFLYN